MYVTAKGGVLDMCIYNFLVSIYHRIDLAIGVCMNALISLIIRARENILTT